MTDTPFRLGAHVVLAVPDRFIQDRHGVTPHETVGRIIDRQGKKWVVNWGVEHLDAHCEEYQLDLAPPPAVEPETAPTAPPTQSQILIDSHMGMTFLVANEQDRAPAEFEREASASDLRWATPIAQGQVYSPTFTAGDFAGLARHAHAAGYRFRLRVTYPDAPDAFLTMLVSLIDDLITQGRAEQAAAILGAHGAEVTQVSLSSGDGDAVITDRGGYIAHTDDAFRDVFLRWWTEVYVARPTGNRLLRKTRAALAAGKDAFVDLDNTYPADRGKGLPDARRHRGSDM